MTRHFSFRRLATTLGLILVGGAVFAMPLVVSAADDIRVQIYNFFGNIILGILQSIAQLVAMVTHFLIIIAQYSDFVRNPVVESGWNIVIGIANMMFIVALLVIAIGTVLRIQNYRYNRLLGNVIVMAFLANVSRTIAAFFIQTSQVVMLTFVNAFKEAAFGNFATMFGLDKVLTFSQTGQPNGSLDILAGLLIGLLFLTVALITIISLSIVLSVRIVMLWILVILSPFAYALRVLPDTNKWASQWWSEFGKWVVNGPVIAFFLWLALAILSQSGSGATATSQGAGTMITQQPSIIKAEAAIPDAEKSQYFDNSTQILNLDNFISFIIAIVFLWMGLQQATNVGGVAGKWVGKVAATGMAAYGVASGLNALRDRTVAPVQGWIANRQRNSQEAVQRRVQGLTNLTNKVEQATVGNVAKVARGAGTAVVAGAKALPGQAFGVTGAAVRAVPQTFKALGQVQKNAQREKRIDEELELANRNAARTGTTPVSREEIRGRVIEAERQEEAAAAAKRNAPPKTPEEQQIEKRTQKLIKDSERPGYHMPEAEARAQAEQQLAQEKAAKATAAQEARVTKRMNQERFFNPNITRAQAAQLVQQDDDTAALQARLGQMETAAAPARKAAEQAAKRRKWLDSPTGQMVSALSPAVQKVAQAGSAGAGALGAAIGTGWVAGGAMLGEGELRRDAEMKKYKEEEEKRRVPAMEMASKEQREAVLAYGGDPDKVAASAVAAAKNELIVNDKDREEARKPNGDPAVKARVQLIDDASRRFIEFQTKIARSASDLEKALSGLDRRTRDTMLDQAENVTMSDGQREMLAHVGGLRQAYTKNGETDVKSMLDFMKNNEAKVTELFRKGFITRSSFTADDTIGKQVAKTLSGFKRIDDDDILEATKDKEFGAAFNGSMAKLADDINNTKGEYKGGTHLTEKDRGSDEYGDEEAILRRVMLGSRGGMINKTDASSIAFQKIKTDTEQRTIMERIMRTKGKYMTKLDFDKVRGEEMGENKLHDNKEMGEARADLIARNMNSGALNAIFEKAPKTVESILSRLDEWVEQFGAGQPPVMRYDGSKLDEKGARRLVQLLNTASRSDTMSAMASNRDIKRFFEAVQKKFPHLVGNTSTDSDQSGEELNA